jgi:hypothetical protein
MKKQIMKVVTLNGVNLERLKRMKGKDGNTLLKRKEVSLLIGINTRTLFSWRKKPDLLPYVKRFGMVRYRYADVIKYLKNCRIEKYEDN